jgi:hypothetical protein
MSVPAAGLGKPSTSVREIETVDGAVLLDIRQGLCLSMTPISVKVWCLLKQNYTIDQITDSLFNEFQDISRQQIHNDIVEFVADLGQKGLLLVTEPTKRDRLVARLFSFVQSRDRTVKDGPSPLKTTVPRCLTLKAVLALLAFDLFRFGNDFPKVHCFVKQWPVTRKLARHDAIERTCNAANHACVFYPKRVLCLQRSFVTTCLLRSCGIEAQLVIGAQKIPFKAHAWTEVNGQPINERRDVQSIYSIWERC